MNLNKMFHASFSAVSPLKSNDELLKSVMERTENMEKKRSFNVKRAVIAVCAAVVAVTAATITVGAANGWNYAEVFQSILGEKTENIMENIVPEGKCVKNSIDNLDIKLLAAAADDRGAIAIIDISSETEQLAINIQDDIYELNYINKYSLDFDFAGIGAGCHWGSNAKAVDENHIIITARMGANTDITNKTIEVSFFENENPDRKWSAEFKADIENNVFIYNMEACFKMEVMDRNDLEEFTKKQTTGEYKRKYKDSFITEIRATPITLHLQGNFPVNYYCDNNQSYAITNNGERITFLGTGNESGVPEGAEYYNDMYIELSEPINPEELKSIVFSGIEVPVK